MNKLLVALTRSLIFCTLFFALVSCSEGVEGGSTTQFQTHIKESTYLKTTVLVTANRPWTATSDASWVSITPSSGGAGDYTVEIYTAENDLYESRATDVYFKCAELTQKVNVVQPQKDAIVVAQSEYEFGVDGGKLDLEVLTNVDFRVSISNEARSWIKQVDTRGLDSKMLHFDIAECTTEIDREGTITIEGGNATQTILVKQRGLSELYDRERAALIALYNATGGDNWTNKSNWCSDRPISEWYGVGVNQKGLVVRISLSDNNLVGEITTELYDLTNLEYLYCFNNQLTSLDVSNNPNLEYLHCGSNQIASLDVSNNAKLTSLYCFDNQLTSLDVSKCSLLEIFSCSDNQLTSLDVSNNPNLESLYCGSNQIASLDVSKCSLLEMFSCSDNQLTSLDVSNNRALTLLDLQGNQLTSLDVSDNKGLFELNLWNNQLTSLDVSNNAKLTSLRCYDNQLTSLNVSNNPNLEYLHCSDNQLTSLDVSDNKGLIELYLWNNQLTSLDVGNNPNLNTLKCQYNKLSYLYLRNNPLLKRLFTYGNSDLSKIYLKSGHTFDELYKDDHTELVYE